MTAEENVAQAQTTIQQQRIDIEDRKSKIQASFVLIDNLLAASVSNKDRVTWLQSVQDLADQRLAEFNDVIAKL